MARGSLSESYQRSEPDKNMRIVNTHIFVVLKKGVVRLVLRGKQLVSDSVRHSKKEAESVNCTGDHIRSLHSEYLSWTV